ncbi:MAG: hypothetical protein ACT4O1_17680 [Gemmatimonadota bacterium]
MRKSILAICLTVLTSAPARAQPDPRITSLVDAISADTIRSYVTSLVGFGRRHTRVVSRR